MRIVFIDYDGVLHPLGAAEFFCWVPLLEALLAAHTDVFLVGHTSWRESHSPEALGAYLGTLQSRFIGATPAGDKLASIDSWLAEHSEVSSYRILDDVIMLETPEDADEPYPRDEFILCHYQKGISCPGVQHQLTQWLAASSVPCPLTPTTVTGEQP